MFAVNTLGGGLQVSGPITIEGEDRHTSVIRMDEESPPPPSGNDEPDTGSATGDYDHLFTVANPDAGGNPLLIRGFTLRNFTVTGSYTALGETQGSVRMVSFRNLEHLKFEDMTFELHRALMISGQRVRGLTMRGCLLSQGRRGGMTLNGASNVLIENNDFRWIADDPLSIVASNDADTWFLAYGGSIRVVGNRALGSRGLNVVGAKNLLIESNALVLGRGRAIHVGIVTDESAGDTTSLDIAIRCNMIVDLLYAGVDPQLGGGAAHQAIDVELMEGGPGFSDPPPVDPVIPFIPGLPNGVNQFVADPTQYYYTLGQGPGGHPTPHAAGVMIESNIIARTRSPAVLEGEADHIDGFNSFDDYGVGPFGGDGIGHTGVQVPLDYLMPTSGISVSGSIRGLTIRGNRIGACDTCIVFRGYESAFRAAPLTTLDVIVEHNDLSDWTVAGLQFLNYFNQPQYKPQRVSILNNRADGDPFHHNQFGTVRSTQGRWFDVAAGSFIDVADGGTATSVGMLVVAGNHVRNVSRLINGFDAALHVTQGSVGYCDPFKVGYHVQNRGIGNLMHPALGWRYVIEGGDPSDQPNYGKVLNSCPLAAAAVPTSGKWVEGTFVKCLTPPAPTTIGGVSYEVTGWRRITTGSVHTLGTHWQQQSARIG